MSRDEIAKQLKGTRVDVETAAKAITEQFKQIRNGGTTTSVALHALRYEITILRHLCCALQENKHEYADIYCEIAANMLPHVAPCPTKPEFWTNHVISLHFIHHALCQEQTIKQCQKFYALICVQRCQLQSQAEYKPYLGIHIKHIYYFCQQMQLQATPEAQYELCQALQALAMLLKAMLQLKTEKNDIIYTDFIVELNQLLGKRSSRFLKTIASLPVKYINKLCDPLFKLIACSESRTEHFPEYLSMLLALLQLDGFSYQQEQTNWSLQLLNSCRDLYKTQTLHKHPIQLLYYYIKLLYIKQSQQAYIDLAQKFVQYFDQKAGAHGQEQWFIDFVLVLMRVQRQLHQIDCKNPHFNEFWTGLEGADGAAAYAAHFQLLQCLIGVATNLSGSSGTLTSNCLNDPSCQSWRKHCIFTLGLCATAAYSNWQATGQTMLQKSAQLCLIDIIRYTIVVAKVLKCMLPQSHEVSNFAWHLCNIADKATTTAQMCFLQLLLQPLQNLLPLLSVQDLRQLLRRLYKASSHCPETDPNLAVQLHSSYMASLANPYNQMCIYYRNTKLNIQTSIYESYMSSPLSIPCLEKRQFFELDMWAVLANRKTPELLQSLLRQRQTDYQAVLLGRHLRLNKDVTQQLEELRLKLQGKQKRTRLQQLQLGHLSVTKLLETHEIQKIKIPVKETAEKCLEEMLIKRKALHLNISTEMPLVELATTAMAAFEAFFNRADAEPIGMDEALIDWEALIDDGIATAVMLATMGYTPQADSAWLLLLRITRFLGDRFNYLRALNYFLPLYTQHEILDLPQEVLHAEQLVDDLWPHLQSPHFFKRHHTIVLLTLCHLALYYGRLDRICHAQLLMLHVERLRDEFAERAGKRDIVQLTLLTVRFRLCYQQQHCRMLARWPTALQQLDNLLLCVRQFVAISSVDQGALMLLLNDLVRDTTECTANRLSECPNFSSSLLQLLLQSGMMLRAVEVLISWLWTNLRMEYLDKAHSKLRLIEHFLCIKPLESSYRDQGKSSPKSCHLTAAAAGAAPMDDQTKHMSELVGKMIAMQLEHQVEPIRKQLTVSSSPRLERRPSAREHRLKLQRYVQDLHPVLRNNVQLQSIYFIVGCLHARLDFLNRDYDQLDKFYALANSWLKQDVKRSRGLGHLLLVLYMHEANFLRATSRKQQAIELLSRAATSIVAGKHLQQRVDVNYRYNLLVQLRSAQLELQPPVVSGSSKLQNPRRALKFNTSPVTKPKRRVVKKPAAFTIYTEDSSFPSSSSSSSSSSSPERSSKSTKRLDMNACQLIEIIDLSDDEQPVAAAAQLKPTKSASIRTRARVQQTETPVAVSVRRIATAPNPSAPPEETPKTTSTRGRTRRGQSATEPPPPAATPSVSTRSRQRN